MNKIKTLTIDYETYREELASAQDKGENMTQLERRLVFLESFKGFCEAYELYNSWD